MMIIRTTTIEGNLSRNNIMTNSASYTALFQVRCSDPSLAHHGLGYTVTDRSRYHAAVLAIQMCRELLHYYKDL